jgi:LysM repeat protein
MPNQPDCAESEKSRHLAESNTPIPKPLKRMIDRLNAVSLVLAVVVAVGGCAAAPPPPIAPEPEPEEIADLEPEPTPQIPLEERIRAPFAVESDGRMAARVPRTSTVVAEGPAPARSAPRDTAADADAAPAGDGDAEAPTAAAPSAPPAPASPPRPAAERAPARPTTPAPTPGATAPREHTVSVGETFYGIARHYGVTPAALTAVNPGIDGERLRAGQVLRLPAYATRPVAAAPATGNGAGAMPAQAGRRTHRVEAGETLWAIARRYGVSMDAIRAANDLEGDTVRLGQTLVIPGS